MKNRFMIACLFFCVINSSAHGGEKIPLRADGSIPVWLSNGPFEIRTIGFGDISDEKPLDETALHPLPGAMEKNLSVASKRTEWLYISPKENGFTDFNEYYGWKTFNTSEKIWYAKIVYAYADLYAAREQNVQLLFGGNTITGLFLNDKLIYESKQEINATKDQFVENVTLQQGLNRLLVKVANSHRNHTVSFFDPIRYEWGFYLRMTEPQGEAVADAAVLIDTRAVTPDFHLTPTLFYKKLHDGLQQKYFVELRSSLLNKSDAALTIAHKNKSYSFQLTGVHFGINQKEIYLPETATAGKARATLAWGSDKLGKTVALQPLPKYELYFMPTTHMDIGYTNPQPIVIERHLHTLDQVVAQCEADADFKWTIETLWLLDNYRQARSKPAFDKLINLIRSGRIAVSPLYTNPYTGWVSEAEMAASFRLAESYKRKYGIDYYGAVYNDVPGQSWALPQYLRQAGVHVLVDGINELFADYKYQKSLPKVFRWAGSSQDTVMLYLTEAYVEGSRYGLERDATATGYRIWQRIHNLLQREYPLHKILISGAFTDNSGIAINQYQNALKWNKAYEYPRFVISTLNDFCRTLPREDRKVFETVRGDWTSDWDILYQGETRRMVKYRWVQNQLPGAEILAALSQALYPETTANPSEIDMIYDNLLHFSGHGSGMEYGLGSLAENVWTDAIREAYVHNAYLRTRALQEQMAHRLTVTKESFESQGVVVLNTLPWERSMPVEIAFPETEHNHYAVIDLGAGTKTPAHRSGDKLVFLAKAVPGIGSRQYELVTAQPESAKKNDKPPFIENEYYQITLAEKGWSIIDKRSGENLFDPSAALPSLWPVRKRFQLSERFAVLTQNADVTDIEKNDVFEELTGHYQDDIYKWIKLRLWRGLDRIDLVVQVNLEGLQQTEYTEEYGLPFAFTATSGEVLSETLGGVTGLADRFKGVGHDFFSIRRGLGVGTQTSCYLIASPDCRIFAVDTSRSSPVVIANLLNNFPKSWNRNEDTNGTVAFRFFLTKRDRGEADIAAFGWEAAAEPVFRKSWFTRSEPVKQHLQSSNALIKILSLRPVDGEHRGYELLLQNSSHVRHESVTLTSELFFTDAQAREIDFMGNVKKDIAVKAHAISLELGPNEIKRILFRQFE